ncbi:DUF2288 family protein [Oxalobacteraceae bacterium OM1]|nr:DUF2288 family protein [Oxalobacteraceae bacterium OM1]
MEKNDERAMLRAKINGETARMPFAELVRFFASGAMILVSDDLDLVEVAAAVAEDDAAAVSQWMQAARVARVTDAQAEAWAAANATLWTVVVKPWILVQRRGAPPVTSVH